MPAHPLPPPIRGPPSQGGSSEGDASEFLVLTQQLAVSSAFGAVQCSYGPCLSVQRGGGAVGGAQAGQEEPQAAQQLPDQQPDMMLLVRFQDESQLQAFLDCPPVAALLEVRPGGRAMCTTGLGSGWPGGIHAARRARGNAACRPAGARPTRRGTRRCTVATAMRRAPCAAPLYEQAASPRGARLVCSLQGDDRIPLRALWSATLLSEPSDSSSTQGVRGGLA